MLWSVACTDLFHSRLKVWTGNPLGLSCFTGVTNRSVIEHFDHRIRDSEIHTLHLRI